MPELVEARLYRGLRDLLPEQMTGRQWMIDTIRHVYELYGFVPLSTPAIEYLDVLTGSVAQETQQSIFRVQGPEGEALGLRFDLTVPLARVVSQYRELPRPFRRYQIASVWRADKPDRGRYREFTQFDIDSVGVESDIADTEIIAAMCDTLTALGVGRYKVRFSSRKVLDLLLAYAQIPAEVELRIVRNRGSAHESTETVRRPAADVFRVLDKFEKLGPEKTRLELTTGYTDESGDPIPGLGLSSEQVGKIDQFLAIGSDVRDEVLEELRALFVSVPGATDEIEVLARISRRLDALGYKDDRVALDLSVARGLAYYTGPVFEAVLLDAPQYGSVIGGGRYDDLVMRFLGQRVPATGASIGVDRLLAALIELGRIPLRKATAQVLVAVIDPPLMDEYVGMTFELRRAGIRAELYLGSAGIGKQIKYADAQQIPIVLMYGGDEKSRNVVTLKDMQVGRSRTGQIGAREAWLRERPGQTEVPREKHVEGIKRLLESI